MEVLTSVFDWFRDADNRGAATALLLVTGTLIAWATGVFRWLAGLVKPGPKAKPLEPALRQTATRGGVNIGGNARDVTTGAVATGGRRDDDPA